ncbi:MAG: hypothetical protein A2W46_01450 [Alphaproteobacteria bacterium RIFCSPHIGHO2_12_42_13]|nr:MAG: hypothetical protein A2Z80_06035 [Alphaproteobacteria bacterium GWA2_41_27]OFW91526.1 MAG: hypothetical protein A2W46_01450 [Alphaproteobacteria bacterium RIFCSPHIGHO2_12_42_13]OFX08794.1 MAG: hypothetical protein A3G78_00855 [Alphaproteobacteria bacterium RIFCSPLOWO2_12_FULL_42_29]
MNKFIKEAALLIPLFPPMENTLPMLLTLQKKLIFSLLKDGLFSFMTWRQKRQQNNLKLLLEIQYF